MIWNIVFGFGWKLIELFIKIGSWELWAGVRLQWYIRKVLWRMRGNIFRNHLEETARKYLKKFQALWGLGSDNKWAGVPANILNIYRYIHEIIMFFFLNRLDSNWTDSNLLHYRRYMRKFRAIFHDKLSLSIAGVLDFCAYVYIYIAPI